MMVVDSLEYDQKLELQRYLFNCSGSSRTSDYATAGEDTQRARRSALFNVSVELALPAAMRGNQTRPHYQHKPERRETAEGKPRRIGTAAEEYERVEVQRLRSQARTANLSNTQWRTIARQRGKELTPAEARGDARGGPARVPARAARVGEEAQGRGCGQRR